MTGQQHNSQTSSSNHSDDETSCESREATREDVVDARQGREGRDRHIEAATRLADSKKKAGSTAEDPDAQGTPPSGKHWVPETDPNIVWWDGPDDPENPYNWPLRRKVVACAFVSWMNLMTPLASSMFAPGVPALLKDFKSDSRTLSSFVVSVYVLGFAFGPLISAPMSELYGRSIVYHVSNVLFVLSLIGCALAPNLHALVAMRFLSGSFGASPLTIGSGSVADVIRQENRGFAMSAYSVGPLLGPIIGPIGGGFLTEAKGWRWVFWLLSILSGGMTLVMTVFMHESYGPTILQRKTARLRRETGNDKLESRLASDLSPRALFVRALVRPLKMLIKSPIVAILAIYIAVVYAYLYVMFTSMSEVFQEQYHFSTSLTGLSFLGMGVGSMMGLAYYSIVSDRSMAEMSKRDGQGMKPEYRLRQMPVGALLLPGGFFMYGWSAYYKVHWMVPIIGTCVIMMSIIIIFLSSSLYLVDAFTLFAASAMASNTIIRSVAGAILPLVGQKLYKAMGLGWGNSLLGFVALACAPAPFLIMAKGEMLRKRYAIKNL